MKSVTIGGGQCGGTNPLVWILGPCVIESLDFQLHVADRLSELANRLKLNWVFKSSFDKANRSSGKSFRGPGMQEGLKILDTIRQRLGVPVTTDVHETSQVSAVAEVCEIIQIPAFLARQTDLIVAAANTGRVVNVKKGQFMAPWDMKNVARKCQECQNEKLLFTERGTTFGYGNLVNDMRAIPWMQSIGYPVIFDATHSVQTPGSQGDRTGGDRAMVPFLARAAVAAGCNGLFIETHPSPDQAPSDGPNMIPLDQIEQLIQTCQRIREAIQPT